MHHKHEWFIELMSRLYNTAKKEEKCLQNYVEYRDRKNDMTFYIAAFTPKECTACIPTYLFAVEV